MPEGAGTAMRTEAAWPWRHVLIGTLTVACLGLIAWAAFDVIHEPCRYGSPALPYNASVCPGLGEDLAPLFVALGLCVAAVLPGNQQRLFPALAFLTFSAVLSTGKAGLTGDDLAMRLYFVLFAWSAVALFALHSLLFAESAPRRSRGPIVAMCLLAAALSLPPALLPFRVLWHQAWYATWSLTLRLSVVLAALLSGFWVLRWWQRSETEVRRRPVRLIAFGNFLAVAPLVLLSMLPDMLGAPLFVPYEVTMFGLFISPLFYSYTASLPESDRTARTVQRFAVGFSLVISFIFLLLLALALASLAGLSPRQNLALVVLLSGVLALAAEPLLGRLRRVADWVWYGKGTDGAGLIEGLSQSLSVTLEQDSLARMLVHDLSRYMHLSAAALITLGPDGHPERVEALGWRLEDLQGVLARTSDLLGHLLDRPGQIATTAELEAWLGPAAASAGAPALPPGACLWLPLVSGGEAYGLLLLGSKLGDDFFTSEDKRLLAALAQRAGVAAHNVRLMDEVRESRQELVHAHRRLLRAAEEERRRLARDLHDGAVQQIIGITYQVAQAAKLLSRNGEHSAATSQALSEQLDAVRHELLAVASQLRNNIGELRPAGLEELGLAAAIEAYVSRLEQPRDGRLPAIELDLQPGGYDLAFPAALSLFRVVQEGLRNALRHAGAEHVRVRLRCSGDRLELAIEDDGCGFNLPSRLSELTASNHFGIMSMSEQVALIPGKFEIVSSPGAGTAILVRVDLKEVERIGEGDN